MDFKIILRTTGFLLLAEAIAMLLPLVVALLYAEPDQSAFLISIFSCFIPGVVLLLMTRKTQLFFSKQEEFLIITLFWIVASAMGSLPFLLSHSVSNFTDAFFEAMAGFTTTGATVCNNINTLPHGILIWRSFSQWLGGFGFIILVIMVVPSLRLQSSHLFLTEVQGSVADRSGSRFLQTLRILSIIYLTLTLLEIILLWAVGMSFFDAVCHAFSTISTGGFSTKQENLAHWNSPFIHYVVIIFMIIGGTNFTLLYMFFEKKLLRVFKEEEFRYYLLFIAGFTLLLFTLLIIPGKNGLEQSFRFGLFQTISFITTTGFYITDFGTWRPFTVIVLLIIYFIGGSTGSTSGGFKIKRVILLLKHGYFELRRIIHPHAVIPVRMNRHTIDIRVLNTILAFSVLYLFVFFFSVLLFSLIKPDLNTSIGAVATMLANSGPGLGKVGPGETYQQIEPAGKWFLSGLMLLGRLELVTVLSLFSGSFRKQ